MRLLYVHRTRAHDGSAIHIRALQAALRARGHAILEVAPGRRLVGRRSDYPPERPGRLTRAAREAAEYGYNLYGALLLERAIGRFRPDCIYQRYAFADGSGALLARRHGLPLVLELNAPFARELQATRGLLLPAFAARLERTILRAAARIVVVSGPLRDELIGAGLDPATIVLTPNGVDFDRFRPDARTDGARSRFRLPPGKLLGFVGYPRAWHRLDLALAALARPDVAALGARLVVVGDGPARGPLAARARALGLERLVTFTGEVDHADLPGLVAAFDVAIMPASTPYASPLKLFEYLAAGRAVVAPRQPNIEAIVRDGQEALLVAPGDVQAFAAAIRRLLGDPDLRERLGRAGRERLLRGGFTWAANAERIEQAIAPLLPARSAPSTSGSGPSPPG